MIRIPGGGTCRLKTVVIHRSNVVGRVCRDGSPRGLDHRRGVRRLVGNVRSFYTAHRRRKGRGVLLASFLSRISLLASRSGRGRKSTRGVALVAVRSTGNLRFGGIFMIKVRRGLFPDTLSLGSCGRLRRRHHLFCITVAHTRRRYCLSFTGDQFGCKGVRFDDPDHFLGSVSMRFLGLPRRRRVTQEVSRETDHFYHRRGRHTTHSLFSRPTSRSSCKHSSSGVSNNRGAFLIKREPGIRVVHPDVPHGLAGINPRAISGPSTTEGLSIGMRTKRIVRRRHFKVNSIVGIRKVNRGDGTAIHFQGTKRGRLLLGFTQFGIIR